MSIEKPSTLTPLLRQRPPGRIPPTGLQPQDVVGHVGGVVAGLVDGEFTVGLGGAVVLEVVLDGEKRLNHYTFHD